MLFSQNIRRLFISALLLSFVFSTIPLVRAASCSSLPRRSFLAGALSKILAAGGVCTSQTAVTEQGSYWIHPDYQGSMNTETDSAGNAVFSVAYRPYGSQLSIAGSSTESLGYTGQREDPSTGLLYLHARYYDPTLGRFISPDPITPGKEIVHLNRYAYADNNPINKTDVTGMGAEGDKLSASGSDADQKRKLEERMKREATIKNPGSITQGKEPTPLDRLQSYFDSPMGKKTEMVFNIASLLPLGEFRVYAGIAERMSVGEKALAGNYGRMIETTVLETENGAKMFGSVKTGVATELDNMIVGQSAQFDFTIDLHLNKYGRVESGSMIQMRGGMPSSGFAYETSFAKEGQKVIREIEKEFGFPIKKDFYFMGDNTFNSNLIKNEPLTQNIVLIKRD